MVGIQLSGFSDEACESFVEQLDYMNLLGQRYIEIRNVDGKNISNLTQEEVACVKQELAAHQISVSSIGSAIGKMKMQGDFDAHFARYQRTIEIAKELSCRNIRIFSFETKNEQNPDDCYDVVIERLRKMIALAKAEDVVLLHENENHIYGDIAPRCLRLMETLYCEHFKAVFDFANFVQSGQDTLDAYELLKDYIAYVHVKDSPGKGVVLPGDGKGNVKEILRRLKADGYQGFLSVEPHLARFTSFTDYQPQEGQSPVCFSDKFAFEVSLHAIKSILFDLNWICGDA